MSATMSDALDTVRALVEDFVELLGDSDLGDGGKDICRTAIDRGNCFLIEAGHEPVMPEDEDD